MEAVEVLEESDLVRAVGIVYLQLSSVSLTLHLITTKRDTCDEGV